MPTKIPSMVRDTRVSMSVNPIGFYVPPTDDCADRGSVALIYAHRFAPLSSVTLQS